MRKEEMVLFPACRHLESFDACPEFTEGSVEASIRWMAAQHQENDGAIARMRELTDGFRPPVWADSAYRALLEGLAELEADLHEHVHEENDLLFPRAVAVEEELISRN